MFRIAVNWIRKRLFEEIQPVIDNGYPSLFSPTSVVSVSLFVSLRCDLEILVNIGSGNGLSSVGYQAITCTKTMLLAARPQASNISEI